MNKEVEIIEQLTKEFLDSFGAEKGVAILSSVICQMYGETDQSNAMVLAQPSSGVLVITTTMDAADQITDIVQKTVEQMPGILERIKADLDEKGETGTLEAVDGETGEAIEKFKPKNKTLH